MCGIVGYIGHRKAAEVLLQGLSQVEYRGYDSAGMAVLGGKGIRIVKDEGKLSQIHKKHNFLSLEGGVGVGHTRWATHGAPCERNAHPHRDCTGKVAVIHNGIVENYRAIKEGLLKRGHKITSDTDTELVAHMIEEGLAGKKTDAADVVKGVVAKLEGSYSLGIVIEGENRLFLARRHAPLVIGIGIDGKEMFFASDMPALLAYTRKFMLLNDGDVAEVHASGCTVWDKDGKVAKRETMHIDWTPQMAQKGGYPHFMLKEIMEQPTVLSAAVKSDVAHAVPLLRSAKMPAIVACGTSYYAGLVMQYLLQSRGKAIATYIGSEFSAWATGKEDLIVAVSQSGETADTLSAVRLAKSRGAKVIAVTNVAGSSLAREADAAVLIGVGPEVGVVATKSFTGQLCALYKIAYTLFGEEKMLDELAKVPKLSGEAIVSTADKVKALAKELGKRKNFFFIARGVGYPCALEAALKLKEITYLHAEAYAAGELKHGPISMMEKDVPVIAIAPSGALAAKIESNIMECKAREASMVVLSDDDALLSYGKLGIKMSKVPDEMVPLYYILPLQLLAYHMTVNAGKDPDQPRNLAKSVTVE